MKLPNWIMLFALLITGMSQYSANAMTAMPAYLGDAAHLVAQSAAVSSLNINSASAEELATLPGIGAKKAMAIIEYRELNGKFSSVEELVNVKGIGPKMLAKLEGYVSV